MNRKSLLLSSNSSTINSVSIWDYFTNWKLASNLDTYGVLRFPTELRWLNGEEYTFMLWHYRAYQALYPNEFIFEEKSHP